LIDALERLAAPRNTAGPLRTLKEAAAYLRVSESMVYHFVKTRQLAFEDMGSADEGESTRRRNAGVKKTARHLPRLRFREEDLDAFIMRRRIADRQTAAPDKAVAPAPPPRRPGRVVRLDMPGSDRYAGGSR
jgi:hypothetical protein